MRSFPTRLPLVLLILLLTVAGAASASDWALDPERSTLGFLSTKNVDIAEAHRFRSLSGGVDAEGNARIEIDLASVDTKVPIRDERMREFVFETGTHGSATVTGEVDIAVYEALAPGESAVGEVRFSLEFRGATTPLLTRVEVTRTGEDALQVSTLDPILLNAANLGVGAGVQKLKELAGLTSISLSVPTWFNLHLVRADG